MIQRESWDDVMTALRGSRLALLDDAHRGTLFGIPDSRKSDGEWLLARHLLREVAPGVYRARATLEAAAMFAEKPPAPVLVQAPAPRVIDGPIAINTPPPEIRVHTHQLAFF
jgi:hypothetical protein